MSPAAKYTAALLSLGLLIVVGQVVLHSMRTEPRDSRMIADRELMVNVVEPGETVETVISVVQREPVDYFRATRGVLALTNKRIVFLGLRPRDMLAPSDAPPAFEQRDFPLDTAVSLTAGRAMAMLTRGVVLRTPDETLRLGVPETSWPEAQKLVSRMTTARERAHAAAVRQEELRKVAEEEWKRAVAAWRKPQYHTVRGGDALGNIATMWNTTPEKLQQLNKLPDNRIRVGQTILVREAMD
ncbi:MAG TPA: LysM peptidoglycan-binding domain-containing protein [Gemmatimonadaceae bacterium]|nr:LysM peptidoglycan-binding domain-containing protein [Gemmatimonadaceae bacterium]